MKKVAVIGAGASGLAAIKCCLDEGLEPTCYEISDYIGGLWHFTETVKDRQACVIQSTVANVSKEMMCFSDFSPEKTCPIYMHHTDALHYFHQYAKHFKLLEKIEFNTEVMGFIITKTRLFKYIENFTTKKGKYSDKKI